MQFSLCSFFGCSGILKLYMHLLYTEIVNHLCKYLRSFFSSLIKPYLFVYGYVKPLYGLEITCREFES